MSLNSHYSTDLCRLFVIGRGLFFPKRRAQTLIYTYLLFYSIPLRPWKILESGTRKKIPSFTKSNISPIQVKYIPLIVRVSSYITLNFCLFVFWVFMPKHNFLELFQRNLLSFLPLKCLSLYSSILISINAFCQTFRQIFHLFLHSLLFHPCMLISLSLHFFMQSLCKFALGWRTLWSVYVFRAMRSSWSISARVHFRAGALQ